MGQYQVLIDKLDEFIRKYYKNQLIKGLLYSVGLVLAFYIAVILLEYFGRFNSFSRTLMFILLLGGTAGVLIKWFVLPLTKLYRLGKIISHEEASRIIGEHFRYIEDKLLNTLQLKELRERSAGFERSLIEAAVDQRIAELSPVPFTAAIDLSKNRKYIKYALPPVLALLLILVVSPKILKEGTERIVNFNKEFIPSAPFQFRIHNKNLKAVQQEDFILDVGVYGEILPNDIFIEVDGNKIKLEKKDKLNFAYGFRNLQQNQRFRLFADGFYSNTYTLEVLSKPVLSGFSIEIEYPKYLNRQPERIDNQGDLSVPQGAVLKWTFNTRNTDALLFIADSAYRLRSGVEDEFSFRKRLMQNFSYAVSTLNSKVNVSDTLRYAIAVIADQYPDIVVDEKKDSVSAKLFYFNGKIKDDYGFSSLIFSYRLKGDDNAAFTKKPIKINSGTTAEEFFHVWNLYELEVKPGDQIDYYFEVADNDGVNGAKISRSAVRSLKILTADELEKQQKESSENIKSSLAQSIKEAKTLQKDLQNMQKNLLNDKNLDWKDKKNIKDLLERQKELEKSINEIQQQNEIKNFQQNEFDQQQKLEILEKQDQLEKLFDQLMTPEMKELYKQLEELMEKVDKDKLMEKLQEMQMKNQDVEKELDRTLELFKQMEFDQKLTDAIDKLKELAKEQDKEAQETKDQDKQPKDSKNNNPDAEKQLEKQEELNKKFEKLSEELKELDKKADELQNGMDLEKSQPKEEEIKKEQQSAKEQLQKKNNKKASENQQKSAEKMQEMAEQLEQMQQAAQSEQMEEDMDALRQLLENLVKLSFDQEKVMENLRKISTSDPKYISYTQLQKKYKDDAKIIKDSLYALSKRIVQLEATVNREISSINRHMDKAIGMLAERQTPQATANQQYVMTSLNNLAIILDEALKQLQQAMANAKPGNGSCSKPGQGKKPSEGSLSKMQEKLAKQLDQMKKEMENGQKPGKKKGQGGPGGMSEQLAKMAAQQAAIRRELEKMSQELNKEGKGAGNQLKDIARQMEETEKDIVNKQIKPETIKRQQDILTRLLEHEKAEREREFDNKRESEKPKTFPVSNPQSYFDYQKKKENEIELLKTVPVGLKPYYKNKTERYFNTLKAL